jgi:signal transduction histidine kinase
VIPVAPDEAGRPLGRLGIGSIRFRIAVAFLAALLAMVFAQAWLIAQQRPVNDNLDLVAEGYLPLAKQVARLKRDQDRVVRDLQRLDKGRPRPVTGETTAAEIYTQEVRDNLEIARIMAKSMQERDLDATELAVLKKSVAFLDSLEQLFARYEDQSRAYLDLASHGQLDLAQENLRRPLRAISKQLDDEFDKLERTIDGRVTSLTVETERMQARATAVAITASAAATLVSVVLLAASLLALAPIGRLTAEVQRVAAGVRGARVEVGGRTEVGVLAREFNAMARAIEERDASLRERAEQEVRAQQRLARSERLALVGQMLAQITHEVRNPLNALSLNAELLADELAALDPERRTEAWELLAMIAGEVERLTDVTGHYLQLARRPPATLAPVDVVRVLDEVVRLLEPELDQAGVALDRDLSPTGECLVDGNQLRQAALNVVRNAVEAGARRLGLACGRHGSELVVTLTDDGPGMTEEQARQATDPFFSTKTSGTGLGLAITRQILEDHDGRVEIASTPGHGTTVRLVLPWRDPVAAAS